MSKHPFYGLQVWKKMRRAHRDRYPLCARCEREGRITPATLVHHKVPHRGDWDLFVSGDNLESSCDACHNRVEQSVEVRGYDRGVGADGWPNDPRHPLNADRPRYSLPRGLAPSAVPVHLVCGPPCSGKTTLARRMAAPEDVVIDLDAVAAEMGADRYSLGGRRLRAALRRRDELLRALAGRRYGEAWVIVSAPAREERRLWAAALGRVTLHELDASREECLRRTRADPRRRRHLAEAERAVEEYFRRAAR